MNLACHTIHKRGINNCKKNVVIMKYLNSASTAMFHPCTYIYIACLHGMSTRNVAPYLHEREIARGLECPPDSFSLLAGDTSSLAGDFVGLKYHAL